MSSSFETKLHSALLYIWIDTDTLFQWSPFKEGNDVKHIYDQDACLSLIIYMDTDTLFRDYALI